MATFIPGQSGEVRADEPVLDVVIGGGTNAVLRPGRHVFRLIVTDDSGNDSEPADVSIIVLDQARPTAIIDVITVTGERIARPAVEIPFGQRFTLTADRSSDVGGVVRSFRWTLLQ
jgi:hypothetical protein